MGSNLRYVKLFYRTNAMLENRARTNDPDPFFAWLSFNVPHTPVSAPAVADLDYFKDVPSNQRREYLAALWRMDYKVGELGKS